MSLRLKMILGIGAILLLVITAYAIVAWTGQARHQWEMAEHEANLIAAVADRALTRGMERGETEAVRAILERIGEHPNLAKVRIVDAEGKILRSSAPGEVGTSLPSGERPVDRTIPKRSWNLQVWNVSVFRPVPNAPKCLNCHPGNQTTLGFINVVASFPPVRSDVAQQWTFLILAAVLSLLAAGGLIAAFFSFTVGRRIEVLSRTMRRVEAGDLGARVVVDGGDELARLGESFNTMVERLADARRQLEDRHLGAIRRAEHLASLGKMAAGIAHEINNPLAGMQNCVRTLLKGPKDEGQRVEYLTMVRDGLGRIGRTVGQLLNFAREGKPQMTLTQLPSLLRRCLALLEHELTARRITFFIGPEYEHPAILADPHQLEQVFLNLLMNAMEAMPNGGRITISTSLREREGHPFVEIQIADTGVGVPPEHLVRIFDPFFTTKDVGKGTGLGLSVSYGIVRAHGGSIEVRSEVGRGSTFTVALPVNSQGEDDAPPDSPSGRRAHSSGDAGERSGG